MMKRMLSLLLVLITVLGMVPFQVNAQQQSSDVVYVDENTSLEDLEAMGVVQRDPSSKKEPVYTPNPEYSSVPTINQSPEREEITAPQVSHAEICDCGRGDADIYHHSDNCALRQYYLNVCAGSAQQIYDLWRSVSQVTQDFLKDYLSANDPEKLAEVYALIEAGDTIEETVTDDLYERLPGEASVEVGGVTVDALGVPEGSSLTVQEPSAETMEILDEIVDAAEDEPEQVFLYDISVQNDESSDWQPEDTTVKMTLSIPGLKLHKYTEVRIIHVDDEGHDTMITGTLDENGNIVFETSGFSTFAGFTVDFHYGSALVSIPGKTSTTLGELFEDMQMPLYASDVVDVQFTDYSLLTVTKEENDWRLTSLVAFDTTEKLTFTMKDGTAYEFVVTDATTDKHPEISTGGGGTGDYVTDSNDYVRWFAVSNGILDGGNSVASYQSQYWAKDAIVYVRGEGKFTFAIAPDPDLSKDPDVTSSCAVYMKQIHISGGSNVVVEVHKDFLSGASDYPSGKRGKWTNIKNVILCSYAYDEDVRNKSLFRVVNGTLTLKSEYSGINLCLRGSYHYKDSNDKTQKIYTTEPLVTLDEGATSFTATNVTFYNGQNGGIYSKATNVSKIELTDCEFENTVYRNGNGGAIYLSAQQQSTSSGHRKIGEVNLTRCIFDGNTAASFGGAIYFGDTIGRIRILDCHFKNCKADRSGGAIAFRGNFGKVSITGTESAKVHLPDGTGDGKVDTSKLTIFTGCEAATNGGAISVETVQENVNGTWSSKKEVYTHYGRVHTLNLSGVRFNNCKARGDYTYVDEADGKTKGNDDGTGGAVNLSAQMTEIGINHCEFNNCVSGGKYTNLGGAGICFGYANLGDKAISQTNNQVQVHGGTPGMPWNTAATWTEKENGVDVTKGNDSRDAVMGYELVSNGTTYTRYRTTYGYVRIEDTYFIDGDSYQGGAFIVRTGSSIEDMYVNQVLIDGCQATDKGSAVFFNNCVVGTANFVDCNIRNCKVLEAINEGGGTFRTVGRTGTVLTFTRCNFVGNDGNIAGGGLYWNAGENKITVDRYKNGMREAPETMVTLDQCTFERNTALVNTAKDDYKESTDANGNVIQDIVTGQVQWEVYKDASGNKLRYSRFGGGIFCETKMVINGCTFTANESVVGGGLCMGVYNSDYRKFEQDEVTELVLDEDTLFTYNKAERGGGLAIRANSTRAIDNDKEVRHTIQFVLGGATLHHNYATQHGGGIYYIAETYDDELENAEVARLIKKVTINDGTIFSNRAGEDGGGVYVNSRYNTTVEVSNGTIYGNHAGTVCGQPSEGDPGVVKTDTGNDDTNGNDIYEYALNSDVISTYGGCGGGIYVYGIDAEVNITGGLIGAYRNTSGNLVSKGNRAQGRTDHADGGWGGGIAVYGGANVTMSGGFIAYNQAHRHGGGISANDGAVVTITGGEILSNKANNRYESYLGSGGGIALNDCSMTVTNGTIANNNGYNGGGIMLSESVMTYEGGTIKGNTATVAGGGIYLDGSSNMYLAGGTVETNSAENGGGIYVNNATGDAANTDVTRQYGMYINGGTIQSNTATNGGGVMLVGSNMAINQGTIKNNTAATAGGGISVHGGSHMYLTGGTVQGNRAVYGGGISVNNSTGDASNTDETRKYGMYIDGGVISGNRAVALGDEDGTAYGGGICLGGGATMKIVGGEISGNTASFDADGTVFKEVVVVTVVNDKEEKTYYYQEGGGIAVCEKSALEIAGGIIKENKAYDGGGMVVRGDSDVQMSGTVTVDENYNVLTYDGAIYNNHAKHYGGGVYLPYVLGGNSMTMEGGYIAKNTTEGSGGGIQAGQRAIFTLTGGYVYENEAAEVGGGLYTYAGAAYIEKGVLKDNYAGSSGGAIEAEYGKLYVTGGRFMNNHADEAGGAISGYSVKLDETYSFAEWIYMSGGVFENNSANSSGGALYAENTFINIGNVDMDGDGSITGDEANATGAEFYNNHCSSDVAGDVSGGALYLTNCATNITTGIFEDNHADSTDEGDANSGGDADGGAMYVTGGTITISGGSFDGNYSTKYGGAAYFDSTMVTIDDGTFNNNASKNGGGLCIIDSSTAQANGGAAIQFTGGEFTNNVADRGGAIFVRSSQVTISDIKVENNHADVESVSEEDRIGASDYLRGGGFYVDTYSNAPAAVTISGGTFTGNTAKNGGGIWANNNSKDKSADYMVTLTITGGTFTENTADGDGGGIWISGGGYADGEKVTSLSMNGGLIQNNTALGNGGGICAGDLAQVNILGTTDAHGEIDQNSAKNGGGIYVTSGADLVVNNGYVTNNQASSPANADKISSGYWGVTVDKLHGAGGGVCVTNGKSGANSTFVLTGDSMAIYGNTATFSGDDVFSNGQHTKLNVPTVVNMDLAGYDFNPEGWFEDYNEGDSQYSAGLQMIPYNGGNVTLDSANNYTEGVQRYRNTDGITRRYMHIHPEYVLGTGLSTTDTYVNKENAYVAMTLGIPTAVEDVVILDYGNKVTMNVWQNDLFMDQADFAETPNITGGDQHNSFIGREMPDNVEYKDGVYYSKTRSKYGDDYGIYESYFQSGMHGKITNLKNGLVTYEPNTLSMDKEDAFFYMVRHRNIWYYAHVTVVPATSIYFEDNFKKGSTMQITYHTDSEYENLAAWETVGTAVDQDQSQDRPGSLPIGGLDADNIYGYDSNLGLPPYYGQSCSAAPGHNYANGRCVWCGIEDEDPNTTSTYYSGGSAHKVTATRHRGVDANGDNKCDECGVAIQLTHEYVSKNVTGQCKICLNQPEQHGDNVPEHTCFESSTYNEYCDFCGKWIGTHTTNARATFTFTGTGFDVVGLSGANTGIVMVTVYRGEVKDFDNPPWENYVASYMVDTYYGYTYDEDLEKWVQSDEADTILYQVPAIKVDLSRVEMSEWNPDKNDYDLWYQDYGYDTYSVEIYVAPSYLPNEHGYWETEFYLDGIRVYNPAGIGGANSETVYNAYMKDNENWPVYAELRNMFITQQELGVTSTNGVIFIDGNTTPTIEQYKSWGPNNEVYLNPSESVAFTLNASNYAMNAGNGNLSSDMVAGIHLGMRGLTGFGKVSIYQNQTKFKTIDMGTTDMYYDITDLMNQVVTITNEGNTPISLTNVKITHKYAPVVEGRMGDLFTMDDEAANVALSVLTPEELTDPVLQPKYPALSFEGMVSYNVFFTAEDLGDLNGADLGLAVFDSYDPEGTVETAKDVILGATQIDGLYMVATNGVHAKYLGDTQYFRAFAKKADGTYVYSKMVSYSALDYARNALEKSSDVKLKQLVVAMLNYGAEAQKFFGYNTDDLMNKDLTAEQQALVSGIDAGALNAVGKVDASKVGMFASTGGFAKKYPAISFKGAFEINYFMAPSNAVDNDMRLYVWNEDTCNSAAELTVDNADKVVNMTLENGLYTASSDQIAAKDLDETVYVAAVYESNGQIYCSGVLPYSIAAYCQKPAADVASLANAAAVYGCAAKEFFGA